MSIMYCHYCDKNIDTDKEADHWTAEQGLCEEEAADKGLCIECGDILTSYSDHDRDEVYYECPGCGSC